jgi:hypothetical protein
MHHIHGVIVASKHYNIANCNWVAYIAATLSVVHIAAKKSNKNSLDHHSPTKVQTQLIY